MNKLSGKILSRKVLAESCHEKAIHSKATVIILYESTELLLNFGGSLVEIGPIAKSGGVLKVSGVISWMGFFYRGALSLIFYLFIDPKSIYIGQYRSGAIPLDNRPPVSGIVFLRFYSQHFDKCGHSR